MATEPPDAPPETADALIALALGELSPAAAEQFRRQLSENSDLRSESARIQRVVDVLRAGGLPSPSFSAVARACSLLASPPVSSSASGLAERMAAVLARMIYDSRAAHSRLGFRNASFAEHGFHLTFQSPDGDVDLQIQPGPPGTNIRILGQVDSPQPARHAFLRRQHHAICEATIDRHGMFVLEAPPGKYELDIILQHGIIRIPSVELS